MTSSNNFNITLSKIKKPFPASSYSSLCFSPLVVVELLGRSAGCFSIYIKAQQHFANEHQTAQLATTHVEFQRAELHCYLVVENLICPVLSFSYALGPYISSRFLFLSLLSSFPCVNNFQTELFVLSISTILLLKYQNLRHKLEQ